MFDDGSDLVLFFFPSEREAQWVLREKKDGGDRPEFEVGEVGCISWVSRMNEKENVTMEQCRKITCNTVTKW